MAGPAILLEIITYIFQCTPPTCECDEPLTSITFLHIQKYITIKYFTTTIDPQKKVKQVGWLVGCFGFNGPLRQYFSLYRAVSQEREKEERKDRGR